MIFMGGGRGDMPDDGFRQHGGLIAPRGWRSRRNPSTGRTSSNGEFLINAQGEDVGREFATPILREMGEVMPKSGRNC